MYEFPLSLSGNGPRISIAIISAGWCAAMVPKGAFLVAGGCFLVAQLAQVWHQLFVSL